MNKKLEMFLLMTMSIQMEVNEPIECQRKECNSITKDSQQENDYNTIFNLNEGQSHTAILCDFAKAILIDKVAIKSATAFNDAIRIRTDQKRSDSIICGDCFYSLRSTDYFLKNAKILQINVFINEIDDHKEEIQALLEEIKAKRLNLNQDIFSIVAEEKLVEIILTSIDKDPIETVFCSQNAIDFDLFKKVEINETEKKVTFYTLINSELIYCSIRTFTVQRHGKNQTIKIYKIPIFQNIEKYLEFDELIIVECVRNQCFYYVEKPKQLFFNFIYESYQQINVNSLKHLIKTESIQEIKNNLQQFCRNQLKNFLISNSLTVDQFYKFNTEEFDLNKLINIYKDVFNTIQTTYLIKKIKINQEREINFEEYFNNKIELNQTVEKEEEELEEYKVRMVGIYIDFLTFFIFLNFIILFAGIFIIIFKKMLI
ncbi:hypothetical protein NUSPORA_02284 [Nucleospora cyclopteri]